MKKRTSATLLSAAAILLVLPLAPADAADEAADERADREVRMILGMNPGLTEPELVAGLLDSARERGVSLSEERRQVAAEAEAAMGGPAPEGGDSVTMQSGSGGDGPGWVSFPAAKRRGDVLYYDSSSWGYNHGHVAVFDLPGYITEAPGGDALSRRISRTDRKVPKGTTYYYVGANTERRDAAAWRAYHRYRGKKYQSRFWSNKDDGDGKLNCSELVWKAFKYLSPNGLRIDLDANGGAGVYPKDIKNSGWLHRYRTV